MQGRNNPISRRDVLSGTAAAAALVACGKIDLHKGAVGRTLDDRKSMEEWGFSDMRITAGKSGGYFGGKTGPKEPYYAYLASLDPPMDRTCVDDIARHAEPRKKN